MGADSAPAFLTSLDRRCSSTGAR